MLIYIYNVTNPEIKFKTHKFLTHYIKMTFSFKYNPFICFFATRKIIFLI